MFTPNPELPDLKADSAGTWQQGQTVKTPETRLAWNCLADWVQVWETLQRRRHSSIRYQQESDHIRSLPIEMISQESVPAVLYAFLEIMASGSGNRPPKGERKGHLTTAMVVAAGNRLSHPGALPYREHRRKQSLRRKLRATSDESEGSASLQSQSSHLDLF